MRSLFLTLFSVAVGICSVMLAADGTALFQRQPWMDEIHTLLIVQDASLVHGLNALADGADYNPPTAYLWFRLFSIAGGSLVALRGAAFLCILIGLAAIVSRPVPGDRDGAFRSWLAAAAASLVVATASLTVQQWSEIRFYAPWFAIAAWHCRVLEGRNTGRWWGLLLVFLFTFLHGTVHYFGLVSASLVSCGFLGARLWFGLRSIPRGTIPVLLAGLAGLGCATAVDGWFLAGQKAALSRPTWLGPLTGDRAIEFLWWCVPDGPVLFLLSLMAAAVLARLSPSSVPAGSGDISAESSRTKEGSTGGAAKKTNGTNTGATEAVTALPRLESGDGPWLSLLLLPVILLLLSLTLQPVHVPRYTTVVVLGWVPLLSALLRVHRPGLAWVLIGVALISGQRQVAALTVRWSEFDARIARVAQEIRQLPTGSLVLIEDRTEYYPLADRFEFGQELFMADFGDRDLTEDSDLRIVQRDVARRVQAWYPEYSLLNSDKSDRPAWILPYADADSPGVKYNGMFKPRSDGRLWSFEPMAAPREN